MIITVKIVPKAKQSLIKEEMVDGEIRYKVYVTEVPEKGKANDALIALLAKHFKCAKKHIHILQGQTTRDKRVEIDI